MTYRSPRGPVVVPTLLTLGLLAARLATVPPLLDPVTGAAPEGLHLTVPASYLVLAPLFTLWDGVSMLSLSRLRGLLVGLIALYVTWRTARALLATTSWRREIGVLLLALTLLVAFLLAGALWHRPMLALAGAPADAVVTDFHSHTNVSHDVRDTWMRGFDAEASRRWHRRAGFDAFFLTDHNTVAGLPRGPRAEPPVVCPGIEISAHRAHIVLLGDSVALDRRPYARSLDGLLRLLRTSDSAYGALSVASLPEYERNHWDRLPELVAAGLDGLEVVNAAPKANEIGRGRRDTVIALARRTDRFVVGVSDSHGWGATSMVWNLVTVPGWRARPGELCGRLLDALRGGYGAVRIVERHRLRADARWPAWLTPLGTVWETWRSMDGWLVASWLGWLWVPVLGLAGLRRRTRS